LSHFFTVITIVFEGIDGGGAVGSTGGSNEQVSLYTIFLGCFPGICKKLDTFVQKSRVLDSSVICCRHTNIGSRLKVFEVCPLDKLWISGHELQLPQACNAIEVSAELLHTCDSSSVKNEKTVIFLESIRHSLHFLIGGTFVCQLLLDFLNRQVEHFHILLL